MNKTIKEALNIPSHVSDLIHPSTRKDIETGNVHFLKILPTLSKLETEYLETISSDRYVELIEKLQKIIGKPVTRELSLSFTGLVPELINKIVAIEKPHKKLLENTAVAIVTNLPEFEHINDLISDGLLRIEAALGPVIPMISNNEVEDADDIEIDMDLFDKAQNINFDDERVLRRIFANTLMAGNAQGKASLVYSASETINKINPGLLKSYGVVMNICDLNFFMTPKPSDLGIMQGTLGTEEIDEAGGVYTIKARGIILPVLIHEITKGIMEFLALDTADTDVMKQADKREHEHYDLMAGIQLDKAIRTHIPYEDLKYYPYVFRKLISTTPIQDIKDMLTKNNRGQMLIQQLIVKIKNELNDME
tara:strand:- start:3397 stop:4491 length:1095 start_codon:yes stop_codon:yes gene_type:complete